MSADSPSVPVKPHVASLPFPAFVDFDTSHKHMRDINISGVATDIRSAVLKTPELIRRIVGYLDGKDRWELLTVCWEWYDAIRREIYQTFPLRKYKNCGSWNCGWCLGEMTDISRLETYRLMVRTVDAQHLSPDRDPPLSRIPSLFPNAKTILLYRWNDAEPGVNRVESKNGHLPNVPGKFPHFVMGKDINVTRRDADPVFSDDLCEPFPEEWTIEVRYTVIIEDFGTSDDSEYLPPKSSWEKEDFSGPFHGQDVLAERLKDRSGVFNRPLKGINLRIPMSTTVLAESFMHFLRHEHGPISNLTLVCEDLDPQGITNLGRAVAGYVENLNLRNLSHTSLRRSVRDVLESTDWTVFRRLKSLNIDVSHPFDLLPPYARGPISIFPGPPLNLETFTFTYHLSCRSRGVREYEEVPDYDTLATTKIAYIAEAMLAIGGPLCEYSLATSTRGDLWKAAAATLSKEMTSQLRDEIGTLLCRDEGKAGWRRLEDHEKVVVV